MITAFAGTLATLVLLTNAFLVSRLLRPRSFVEQAVTLALATAAELVLVGYAVSAVRRLDSLGAWTAGIALFFAATGGLIAARGDLRALALGRVRLPGLPGGARGAKNPRRDRYITFTLGALLAAVTVAMVVNLVLIFAIEPGNYDALSYHLARIGYYLQAHTLAFYGANFWAQVAHPKVATVLMTYACLAAGGAIRLTQLVQFVSCLVSMLAIFGISRDLELPGAASLVAALLFGMLPITITEAATAQNDLVMTALIAAGIFYLLEYRRRRELKYLVLGAAALALACGVKATFFSFLPAVVMVKLYAIWPAWKDRGGSRRPGGLRRQWGIAGAAAVACLMIFTLPAGYWENWREIGNPFGPKTARAEQTFLGAPPGQVVRYGAMNLVRYACEFAQLDGMPSDPLVRGYHQALLDATWGIQQGTGLPVFSLEGARRSLFGPDHMTVASANMSFFGVLGAFLIWPLVLAAAVRRKTPAGLRLFAAAALVAFATQAFVGPYDYYRGRYFMTVAVFALPAAAAVFPPRGRAWRVILAAILFLGAVSAVNGALVRESTPLVAEQSPSVFGMDRAHQLTREATDFDLAAFEAAVGPRAVVALDTSTEIPDYIFFGEKFGRRLVPLNPLWQHHLPLPPEAEALIFDERAPYKPGPGDIPICRNNRYVGNIWLRRLR